MHEDIESYLIIQSLSKDKTKIIKEKGKEYVASNIDSIMLYRKAVIISDEWFMLHVHPRFTKQIVRLLKKAGVDITKDVSKVETLFCTKVYVIQNPANFIPHLMKFEELIVLKKD